MVQVWVDDAYTGDLEIEVPPGERSVVLAGLDIDPDLPFLSPPQELTLTLSPRDASYELNESDLKILSLAEIRRLHGRCIGDLRRKFHVPPGAKVNEAGYVPAVHRRRFVARWDVFQVSLLIQEQLFDRPDFIPV